MISIKKNLPLPPPGFGNPGLVTAICGSTGK